MIVPISLPSTPRMFPVRNLLIKNSGVTWRSDFADRPGTLFTGVHQKLSIVICAKEFNTQQHLLFSTEYNHWYGKANNEREWLMDGISYVPSIDSKMFWIRSGNYCENAMYKKLDSQNKPITIFFKGTQNFSINMRMMYWGKSFMSVQNSNEYKRFPAPSIQDKGIFVAIFNSSLYFWFWELISDCWHITEKELNNFKLNLENLSLEQKTKLLNMTNDLMTDLDSKKTYVGSKQTDYEYYHKLSKPLIDQIDCLLAVHYGFTHAELDFIINYDIKYRMGKELDSGEDGE